MSHFSLILFSDIHFGCREIENQGPVIEAFCRDIKLMCEKREGDLFLFCIGDLVQAADDAQLYNDFKNSILDVITDNTSIKSNNILLLPGNHDAQKSIIASLKDERFKKIKSLNNEKDFNDYIRDDKSVILPFEHFINFCKTYYRSEWKNHSVHTFDINDQWKAVCLNSALLTFAHIDDIKDSKYLAVDTRSLTKWINDNANSKLILLMHHPIEDLSNWASEELSALINTHFDVVVTGHTHSQFTGSPLGTEVKSIHCRLPHLFHDKHEDAMGYAILDFNENIPYRIQYREWNNKRHRFVPGTSFVDDDLGVLKLPSASIIDKHSNSKMIIERELHNQFTEAMKVYNGIPDIQWETRVVSSQPIEKSIRIPKENLFYEKDLFEFDGNIMIFSPRDLGLTCYGLHFALELCREKDELAIYIDNPNIKMGKLQNIISERIERFQVTDKEISWFIIDEWVLTKNQEKDVLAFFHEKYPDARLLVLSPRLEKFFTGKNVAANNNGFACFYMVPLSRNQLRHIASSFNKSHYIAEEDVLLNRLDYDIRSFNMHRSPLNCINLLYVFGSSFDKNPVNRTQVLERVLTLIFDNDTPPTYSTTPDLKDCIQVLGILAKRMITNKDFSFSKNTFVKLINDYALDQDLSVDSNYLFSLLLRNHIIMPDEDRFRFKASYWVYFFAACRMQVDSEFTTSLLNDHNYLNYPLIVEFFAGISRQENDTLKIITGDLEKYVSNVKVKLGLPKGWAPYNQIKFRPSEKQTQRLLNSLNGEIRGSNLPGEVKDVMSDVDYDQRKPFHQDVFKILEEYDVVGLMNFISISSRVLRNSDYAKKEIRRKLFDHIIEAWKTILDALSLFAPALAFEGGVSLGDARFIFADEIQYTDPRLRIITVLRSLPSNILRWFEQDLFSSRNAPLYYNFLKESKSFLSLNLVACLIIRQLPDDWKLPISKYLDSLDINSYYLGESIETMQHVYKSQPISDDDANTLKDLIQLWVARYRVQKKNITPRQIKRIFPSDELDQRHDSGLKDDIE